MIGDIFHVAIRAVDLDATVGFYCEALGFRRVLRPAGLKFPGAWLAAPHAKDEAILHVYAKTSASGLAGSASPDSERGNVDHIAFRAQGFIRYQTHLRELGLTVREQHLNGNQIWQMFVHDPNGIKLELSFNQTNEPELPVDIPTQLRYIPNESFFDSAEYTQFKSVSRDI